MFTSKRFNGNLTFLTEAIPTFQKFRKRLIHYWKKANYVCFMFHSKIGKYTEEEFTLATELKKKLFAFFKKGFSPESDDEISEWSKLQKFKKSMGATILYKDYETTTDFELLLNYNLSLYLSEEFSAESSDKNNQLSPEVTTLLKVLGEKIEENELLKAKNLAKEENK